MSLYTPISCPLPLPCEVLVDKRWEGDFLPFAVLTMPEFLIEMLHSEGVAVLRAHMALEAPWPPGCEGGRGAGQGSLLLGCCTGAAALLY